MRKSILVMSGKGGVGKTTVAVNLAHSFCKQGFSVGILDVDIHGPNVLKMLGHENVNLEIKDESLLPLNINSKLKVASLAGFVDDASAVIWRGPRKHGAIKQLTQDVLWGDLDYLIVDFPPGTGDEHISTAQLLPDVAGAIIVSTPQQVSIMDMMRSVDFCKQMKIPILGVIENMSGGLFGSGTVSEKCEAENLLFLGDLSLSKEIITSSEQGTSFLEADETKATIDFKKIKNKIIGELEK